MDPSDDQFNPTTETRGRQDSRSPAPRGDDPDTTFNRPASRSRSASPNGQRRSRSPQVAADRRSPPAPPQTAPKTEPSNVVGVFGLSIRTEEKDLEFEFGRIAPVEKVVIVYDARTARSRGFGFVTMGDTDAAANIIKELNGMELHGRRLRIDYSATVRPHEPTPGEYRGAPRDDHRLPPRYPPRGGYGGGYGGGYDSRGPPPPRRGGYGGYGGGRGGYHDGGPPRRGGYGDGPPPYGGGYRGPPGGGYGGPDREDWRRRERSPMGRGPPGGPPQRFSRSPPPMRRYGSRSPPPGRRYDDRPPRRGGYDSPPRERYGAPNYDAPPAPRGRPDY